MKIDAMSAAAVGFAAFAAYYALRRPSGAANSPTAAQQVWGMAAAQRRDVGANLYQNTAEPSFFNGTGVFRAPTSVSDNAPSFFDGTGAWRL